MGKEGRDTASRGLSHFLLWTELMFKVSPIDSTTCWSLFNLWIRLPQIIIILTAWNKSTAFTIITLTLLRPFHLTHLQHHCLIGIQMLFNWIHDNTIL